MVIEINQNPFFNSRQLPYSCLSYSVKWPMLMPSLSYDACTKWLSSLPNRTSPKHTLAFSYNSFMQGVDPKWLTLIRPMASCACIILIAFDGWPSEINWVEPRYRARNRTPSMRTVCKHQCQADEEIKHRHKR